MSPEPQLGARRDRFGGNDDAAPVDLGGRGRGGRVGRDSGRRLARYDERSRRQPDHDERTAHVPDAFGAQAGAYTTTVSDSVDPVVAGGAVTYRFVTPFRQTLPGGITGTYRGGQVYMHIPTGLNVTAVSTQAPPGGSQLSASASKQGNDIVVTTSGNVPINGSTYPTPDLIVQATTAPTAGGTQIRWLIPFRITANVDIDGIGPVDADCAPNNANTVTATTNVDTPGNRAPVFTDRFVPVTKNTPKVIALTATDPDGNALTFTAAAPSRGTVVVNGASATYTPLAGYLGADFFIVTVSDGLGGVDTGRVDLRVEATNEGDTYPPGITLNAPLAGAVYTPGQVVNASFSCSDGETGMQSCVGSVANGTPINTGAGRRDFTVTATDNFGNVSRRTVSYQVVSRTPVAQNYNAGAGPNVIPITCNQPVVPFTQAIPAPVAAPTIVPQADTFVFRFSPGSMSVLPSTVATNAKYVVPAPSGGTIIDVRTVPGTGTANAANTYASIVNGKAVLTVPDVDGGLTGATFTPKQLEVTIRATAAPTAEVTTRFERFQVRLTTGQQGVDILTTDYDCPNAAPNTVLTRTTVLDVTPPAIALTSPAHGGRYLTTDTVNAAFTCSDAHTVASCTGTRANGTAIDTATIGRKSFTVTSTDAAGNAASALRVVPRVHTRQLQLVVLDGRTGGDRDRRGRVRLPDPAGTGAGHRGVQGQSCPELQSCSAARTGPRDADVRDHVALAAERRRTGPLRSEPLRSHTRDLPVLGWHGWWASSGRTSTRDPGTRPSSVVRDLLHGPAVAVGVAEVDEPAPREILDGAHIDPAALELGARRFDVGDDELEAGDRPRLRAAHSLAERDRTRRTGRRHLDEADLVADDMVVVGVEAGLLVERLGPVDVGNRDGDEFELEIHDELRSWG